MNEAARAGWRIGRRWIALTILAVASSCASPPAIVVQDLGAVAPSLGARSWGEPRVLVDELMSDQLGLEFDVDVNDDGRWMLTWCDGDRQAYRVMVAESTPAARGKESAWSRTNVGCSEDNFAPATRVRALPEGGAIVLVHERLPPDAGPACRFTRRERADGEFSPLQPLGMKSSGGAAIELEDGDLAIAYVRAVACFSARKLFGDFVHDPPLQDYGKVCLGRLVHDHVIEQHVFEADNLLECETPRLRGDHLLYETSGLLADDADTDGAGAIVHVQIDREFERTVLASHGRDYGGSFQVPSLAEHDGRAIVAFDGKEGVVVAEQQPDRSWTRRTVLRGCDRCALAVAADGTICVAGILELSNEVFTAIGRGGDWSALRGCGSAEHVELRAARDDILLFSAAGGPEWGSPDVKRAHEMLRRIEVRQLRTR